MIEKRRLLSSGAAVIRPTDAGVSVAALIEAAGEFLN